MALSNKGGVPPTYDTAKRTAELIPTEVTVAGHTFGVKRSGKVLRQIIAMAPEDEFVQNDDGSDKTDADGEKVPKDDDADSNIELLYQSLALLFVDPESGKTPKLEKLIPPPAQQDDSEEYPETFAQWLEWELDIDVAQELMGKLVPRRGEGNASATVSAPAS